MSLFGIIQCQEISWVKWLIELGTIMAPCKAERVWVKVIQSLLKANSIRFCKKKKKKQTCLPGKMQKSKLQKSLMKPRRHSDSSGQRSSPDFCMLTEVKATNVH